MNSQPVIEEISGSYSGQELIAACGLYCGSCGIYIATQEKDSEKILQYAVVLNQSYEDTLCDGCGAVRKSLHCSRFCNFFDCKHQKGVTSCNICDEFPCQALYEFKFKMPHRAEIIDSLKRLGKIGAETWLNEMKDYFSCPRCKTINSAYHLTCHKCGEMPSCKFVSEHNSEIERYLSE
jgi:phage FluMu protein Com